MAILFCLHPLWQFVAFSLRPFGFSHVLKGGRDIHLSAVAFGKNVQGECRVTRGGLLGANDTRHDHGG